MVFLVPWCASARFLSRRTAFTVLLLVGVMMNSSELEEPLVQFFSSSEFR